MYFRNKIIYILFAIVAVGSFSSCKEESDMLSTDTSLKLSFLKDTVRFDTVFTTTKTSTKRILIYNNNKNSLNIESVRLMRGKNSFFRINVDGFSGDQENVRVRGRDSMYVFVELTIDPQNRNNPVLIEDSIRFMTNGNAQYLRLEAYGQDVYIWNKRSLQKDTVLTGEKPFLVYDTLTIAKDAHVTIRPGVKFFFHSGASLNLKGRLSALGSVEHPIVFRGDRTDRLFSDVLYDNGVTAQWDGMIVDSLSYNNIFENVQIRNSIKGIYFKRSLPDQKKATLTNVIVNNVRENGITATNCNIEFFNCLLSNAKEMCVKLTGGKYSFLHCTLANYFSTVNEGRGIGSGTLSISNILGKDVLPLDWCNFTNCIIAGPGNREVVLNNKLNGVEQPPFNYLFTNCLISVNGTNDENFINIIWNRDPSFVNLNKNRDYVFNFELDSTSIAINAASKTYSVKIPFDLKGGSRLNDNNPDLGCYEWRAKTK